MNFLSPLLLAGLIAMVLPLIIHLINRKEPQIKAFPAIEFLRRAYQKNAKKIKLKQFLLILVRTLIIAFLVFALSRPYYQKQSTTQLEVGSFKADSAVIVIDQSYQMAFDLLSAPDQELTLLTHSKNQALALLDEHQHPMALVIAGAEIKTPVSEISADFASLRESISKLKVEPITANLEMAILEGIDLLKKRPTTEKRQLLVFSTPAQAQRLEDRFKDQLEEINLLFVDSRDLLDQPEKGFTNRAVGNVLLTPSPQRGNHQWKLEATVWNWSDLPVKQLPIWVEVGGEIKVKSLIDIPAQSQSTQRFYFQVDDLAKQSKIEGAVKIAEDQLKLDNQVAFMIEPQKKINVLAINGDPRPTPREDELFFFEKAISAKASLGEHFRLTIKNGDDLENETLDLKEYDVVVIANMAKPSIGLGQMLEKFVMKGGGVFLTLGERVEIERWNQAFASFLPKPLRERKIAGDASQAVGERKLAYFEKYKETHPLFSFLKYAFGNLTLSSLGNSKIKEYVLFEPVMDDQSKTLIELSEGMPILVEKNIGQGQVILYASSLDLSWGDLCLQPDFVPLIQNILKTLTQQSQNQQMLQTYYGKSIQLEINASQALYLINPLKEKTPLPTNQKVDKTQRLGFYFVEDANGQNLAKFQVVLDSSQGRLDTIKANQDQNTQQGSNEGKSSKLAQLAPRKELWHISLLLIFALLMGETYLMYQKLRVK